MLTCGKGASSGELLIEAARRNNTDLLQEVIDGIGNADKAAVLLNETKTVLGNYIYHEAALRGNCTFRSSSILSLPPLALSYLSLPRLLRRSFAPCYGEM
jgi:hypothetical protein